MGAVVFPAVVVVVAAAASLFSPSSIPAFNKLTTGQGAEAVRWWSVAVISLGAAAFLVRNAPDSDVGKQAIGFGMLIYNIFLSIFCLRDYPKASSVGVLVHIPLAVGFLYWLKTSTAFFSF